MKLDEITRAIARWQHAKRNPNKLRKLLGTGKFFPVYPTEQSDDPKRRFLHAYPGIHKGRLLFFVINALRDTEEQHHTGDGLLSCISICEIEDFDLIEDIDPIPPGEAIKRILSWHDHHEKWIRKEVTTIDGPFECYVIPQKGLGVNRDYQAFFALQSGIVSEDFRADLVLFDPQARTFPQVDHKENNFFDTVRLVPPFPPGELTVENPELKKANFFLMNLAERLLIEA